MNIPNINPKTFDIEIHKYIDWLLWNEEQITYYLGKRQFYMDQIKDLEKAKSEWIRNNKEYEVKE